MAQSRIRPAGTGPRTLCICSSCPSCTECMRGDDILQFCINGPADHCMFDRKGCRCSACPARPPSAGSPEYYCIGIAGRTAES